MAFFSFDNQISRFKNLYNNASPFRHLVIDDFLEKDFIEEVLMDFPGPDSMDVHGTDSKRVLGWQLSPSSTNYSLKPSIIKIFDYLKSTQLRAALMEITGIQSQIVSDPDYYGSGLLLAPRGGVHKVHADRTYNPNPNFFPRLILVLYFNKNWQPNYGGGLQLWDRNIKKCITIAPNFNRCVIFEVSSIAYHSIEDVNCPENFYRRALNYYYLSNEPPLNSYIHDTVFFPRPNERLDYWKACATTNFPKELIGTIASRSPITRKLHSTTRSLIKKSVLKSNPTLQSDDELMRWKVFNDQI